MGRCYSIMNPNKNRLRRTMLFLNAQKPALIKDPYIYKPDTILLDLEDAVAEKEKDAARFSLYHALKEINYRGIERIVSINGLDSELWQEDIRCAVAGGADGIRIPKTETSKDVKRVEEMVERAEKEFGIESGKVLIMAALESAKGVLNALDICNASERLFGIALSGRDYTKDLQTHLTGTGVELTYMRIKHQLNILLSKNQYPNIDLIKELDADFVRKNISPGGSADLLAVCWFLYFIEKWAKNHEW